LKRLVFFLLLASLVPAAFADSSQSTPTSSESPSAAPASATTVQFKNGKADSGSFSLSSIPEPGRLCLLGTGLLGVAGFMRRRLRAKSIE